LLFTFAAAPVPASVGASNLGSLSFDGLNDYAFVQPFSSSYFSEALTVELWVKPASLSPGDHTLLFNNNSTGFFLNACGSDLKLYFTNHILFAHGFFKSVDTWVHLAVTFQDGRLALYRDGVFSEDWAISPSCLVDPGYTRISIGGSYLPELGHTGDFEGCIDEIRIWESARSEEEIRASLGSALTGEEPGLIAYWDFEEQAGQTAADLSGHGNDGRLGDSGEPDSRDPLWVASAPPPYPATSVTVHVRDCSGGLIEDGGRLTLHMVDDPVCHGSNCITADTMWYDVTFEDVPPADWFIWAGEFAGHQAYSGYMCSFTVLPGDSQEITVFLSEGTGTRICIDPCSPFPAATPTVRPPSPTPTIPPFLPSPPPSPTPTPIEGGHPAVCGLFGTEEVIIENNAYFDSYDPERGGWRYPGDRWNGQVGSNLSVVVMNNAVVYGDARVAPGGQILLDENGAVQGDIRYDAEVWYPPPVLLPVDLAYTEEADPRIGGQAGEDYAIGETHGLTVYGGRSITLAGGTYRFAGLELENNARVVPSGPVVIYVEGDLSLKSNSAFNPRDSGASAADLTVYLLEAGPGYGAVISNNAEFQGCLYLPESGLEISNNDRFFGSATARRIRISNNAGLHADESFCPETLTSSGSSLIRLNKGDYDGDGASDPAVFRPDSGRWAIRGLSVLYFGGSGFVPLSGDYDGDGSTDIAVFAPESGEWAVRNLTRFRMGGAHDTAVPADYNGDGRCDPAVYRPGEGLWAIRGFDRVHCGRANDLPVPADYDGDGCADAAVYRPRTGLWAIGGKSRCCFGREGDIPIPGRYRVPGRAEMAVYRPLDRLWAIGSGERFVLGSIEKIPLVGDFDADGRDEAALFKSSSGLWVVRNLTRIYYGRTGDLPATR
jgi:hypothetical protein